MTESKARQVEQTFTVPGSNDGDGAKVHRLIGGPQRRRLNPILMLDHFSIETGHGFPDHPHRGQETITYMLKGHLNHEDFTGAAGTIGPGDLQCMTAGKGVVHAEMPSPESSTESVQGIQIWVDLPRELKNCEPRYRDLRSTDYEILRPSDLLTVRLISGESFGHKASHQLAYNPVWLMDIEIQPGGSLRQQLPTLWNGLVYVLQGSLNVNTSRVNSSQAAVLSPSGDYVDISVSSDAPEPARLIFIAASPIDQPVVQHGPFVSTSQTGIQQAVLDFHLGANGFERAIGWRSKIANQPLH